jgi:hypothetical protein
MAFYNFLSNRGFAPVPKRVKEKRAKCNKIQAGKDSTTNPKTYAVVGAVVRGVVVPGRDSTAAAVEPAAAAENAMAVTVDRRCPLPSIACHIIHSIAVRIEIVNWAGIGKTGKVKRVSMLSKTQIIICIG